MGRGGLCSYFMPRKGRPALRDNDRLKQRNVHMLVYSKRVPHTQTGYNRLALRLEVSEINQWQARFFGCASSGFPNILVVWLDAAL